MLQPGPPRVRISSRSGPHRSLALPHDQPNEAAEFVAGRGRSTADAEPLPAAEARPERRQQAPGATRRPTPVRWAMMLAV
jgi:hypothetical protein